MNPLLLNQKKNYKKNARNHTQLLYLVEYPYVMLLAIFNLNYMPEKYFPPFSGNFFPMLEYIYRKIHLQEKIRVPDE